MLNDHPGLIEKILLKLFSRFDIVKMVNGEETLYLRRFHILKRNKLLLKLTGNRYEGIYLHHILKPDEDRHLHNHPWNFASFIIAGGYTEEIPNSFTSEFLETSYRSWGQFSFRASKATQFHRIISEGFKKTWTLFFVGPKFRKWQFLEENGSTDFDIYLSKYCPEQMKPTNDITRIDIDS